MGVGGQRQAPAAVPLEKTRGRLGGPRPDWRVRKISPLPEFDPRTVEPVASRYTDWTVPAHLLTLIRKSMFLFCIRCNLNFLVLSSSADEKGKAELAWQLVWHLFWRNCIRNKFSE
jgi:hypothetical protein